MHWVSMYGDVYSEMIGEDRAEALAVIEDDAKFDTWLRRYMNKQNHGKHKSPKGKAVSKEEFLSRMRKDMPGPEDGNN